MKRSYLQDTKFIYRSLSTKNFRTVAYELTECQTRTLVQVFSISGYLDIAAEALCRRLSVDESNIVLLARECDFLEVGIDTSMARELQTYFKGTLQRKRLLHIMY